MLLTPFAPSFTSLPEDVLATLVVKTRNCKSLVPCALPKLLGSFTKGLHTVWGPNPHWVAAISKHPARIQVCVRPKQQPQVLHCVGQQVSGKPVFKHSRHLVDMLHQHSHDESSPHQNLPLFVALQALFVPQKLGQISLAKHYDQDQRTVEIWFQSRMAITCHDLRTLRELVNHQLVKPPCQLFEGVRWGEGCLTWTRAKARSGVRAWSCSAVKRSQPMVRYFGSFVARQRWSSDSVVAGQNSWKASPVSRRLEFAADTWTSLGARPAHCHSPWPCTPMICVGV